MHSRQIGTLQQTTTTNNNQNIITSQQNKKTATEALLNQKESLGTVSIRC